jgi:16S rRNA (guanine527-N7)-methyltransferase
VHYLSEQNIKKFKERIINGSTQLGVKVSDHQANMMMLHSRELMIWNKKTNLTAIKDPMQIAEKHFIDSVAAISFLGNEKTLVDMGAGGGFPGIVLKIMNPDLKVVMIDSSRKKINFLKHVIRTLHLENIDAIHSRVEDLHENDFYKAKFDAVISRAFTELSGFVAIAFPFLSKGGSIYAMKGKNADQEITPAILKKFELKLSHYQLPFEKSDRYMVKIRE